MNYGTLGDAYPEFILYIEEEIIKSKNSKNEIRIRVPANINNSPFRIPSNNAIVHPLELGVAYNFKTERKDGSIHGWQNEFEIILSPIPIDYYKSYGNTISNEEFKSAIDSYGNGFLNVGDYYLGKGCYWNLLSIKIHKYESNENKYFHNNPHKFVFQSSYIQAKWMCTDVKYHREKIAYKKHSFEWRKAIKSLSETADLDLYRIGKESDMNIFTLKVKGSYEQGELIGFDEIKKIAISEPHQPKTGALVGSDYAKVAEAEVNQSIEMRADVQALSDAVMMYSKQKCEVIQAKAEQMVREARERADMAISKANAFVTMFTRKIEYLNRFISMIKIHSGQGVELVQISEGQGAGTEVKLRLRQLKLYVSEELALTREWDSFKSHNFTVDELDRWLIETGKYKTILPDPKCVVCLQLKRKGDYGRYNPITDKVNWNERADLREHEAKAFFYFRNGDNVFRVVTDEIKIQKTLFPQRDEAATIMNAMQYHKVELDGINKDFMNSKMSKNANKSHEAFFMYQRVNVLIGNVIDKGVMDMPKGFSYHDFSNRDDYVEYVYDYEDVITDGKPSFNEWLSEVNSKIKKGSRIVYVDKGMNNEELRNRIPETYQHEFNFPNTPETNIYTVDVKRKKERVYSTACVLKSYYFDEIKKENPLFLNKVSGYYFDRGIGSKNDKYVHCFVSDTNPNGLPNGENVVYEKTFEEIAIKYYPEHEYKGKSNKRISFKIFNDDCNIINLDEALLKDVEYYMNDRVSREDYDEMLPVLYSLKKMLLKEQEEENEFTYQLCHRVFGNALDSNLEKVRNAVFWWKNERATVWKRPIKKDHEKAWRMIEKRLKKLYK